MVQKKLACVRVVITLSCLFFLTPTTPASGSYTVTPIAVTGQEGLTGIQNGVSINDKGTVAFVGRRAGGDNLFIGDGSTLRNLRSGETLALTFSQNVQINNNNQVVARDQLAPGGGIPARTRIRIWDGNATDTDYIIAEGSPTGDFDGIIANTLSINNKQDPNILADIVFAARTGTQNFLVTSDFNQSVPLSIPLRPMIADDRRIVVRAGNQPTNPILLYEFDLGTSQVIADTSMGFTALGQSPGISDDGSMVAFYGELSAAGASALGLPPGQGIFVAIRIGGQWILHHVAGIGGGSLFSTFDPNARVAVNNTRTIVYMAFNQAGEKGIYVSQVSFFLVDQGGHERFPIDGPPIPVVEQGDDIGSLTSIVDLGLHDPINNHGDLAFWVATSNSTAVVRATRGCEGANYADPQTATYINQYDAGIQLTLPFNSMGQRGGNACGPSSLAMLVNAAKRVNGSNQRLDLREVYTVTMEHYPEEFLNNSFFWSYGKGYARLLGYPQARLVQGGRTELDMLLDQGMPVLGGVRFAIRDFPMPGGGHVVLFLGRTAAGDYIVNDPAGNYFSSVTGHYGRGKCGELSIYPKTELDRHPELLKLGGGRMLVIPPQPGADPEVLIVSFQVIGPTPPPFALWLEDGAGRRTGFLADGTTTEGIPESEVDTEILSATDPEAPFVDAGGLETTLYSIQVVTPDAQMRAFVHGLQNTNYTLDIRRFRDVQGVTRMTATGIVSAGETQAVNLQDVPACAVDVTSSVTVIRGGYRRNKTTGRYVQQVTVKNTGSAALTGPVSLVLDNLSSNAALLSPMGSTSCVTPVSPYKDLNIGADNVLSVGESASIVLEFTNSINVGITYSTRVLAGPDPR